ncbi:S4 domain-containing protein, partial [Deinococcus pimensis]|uniref:S4 domain-containing protein n=1 Tax=Deinococcus pimensis TaxID=309888 RepID=UPI002480C6E7
MTDPSSPTALDLVASPGRLDAVLSALSGVSRSQVSGWIEAGRVRVGGVAVTKA